MKPRMPRRKSNARPNHSASAAGRKRSAEREKRVDREMTFRSPAVFRLLVKGSLMEFYLDDILIESFALPANATGRIGLINAVDTMGTLKAWN